ncbi:transmembrane protein, putative [Medicago truncatula]|uniref:Transmembrane protein, putative n=1 Tax=Medicago truncatula TaxID=3880 RepID=G7I960_MEDTR|nr:transmembrane protein, putative [Medicago truncatula]
MEDLESIRHVTTFLQWDLGGGLLFIVRVNLHEKLFIRMRTRGRVLQKWRRLL